MNLASLPVAELEAAEAAIWYDDQRRGLGDEFIEELRQAFSHIESAPRSFQPLRLYAGGYDIRSCLIKRFPYVVIFRCRTEEVLIVAVSHVRRKPLYWLERLA